MANHSCVIPLTLLCRGRYPALASSCLTPDSVTRRSAAPLRANARGNHHWPSAVRRDVERRCRSPAHRDELDRLANEITIVVLSSIKRTSAVGSRFAPGLRSQGPRSRATNRCSSVAALKARRAMGFVILAHSMAGSTTRSRLTRPARVIDTVDCVRRRSLSARLDDRRLADRIPVRMVEATRHLRVGCSIPVLPRATTSLRRARFEPPHCASIPSSARSRAYRHRRGRVVLVDTTACILGVDIDAAPDMPRRIRPHVRAGSDHSSYRPHYRGSHRLVERPARAPAVSPQNGSTISDMATLRKLARHTSPAHCTTPDLATTGL